MKEEGRGMVEIELERLVGHPGNCNAMGREALAKLMRHIRRSGRYPPLVVRRVAADERRLTQIGEKNRTAENVEKNEKNPTPEGVGVRERADANRGDVYQVLDGHQRLEALRRLKKKTAACVVWEGVGDDEALVLLATLNRLRGQDDPRKRGLLIQELEVRLGAEAVGRLLPEKAGEIQQLLELSQPPPEPREARRLEDWPVAVHFFLVAEQRWKLEEVLKKAGGTREEGLMRLVEKGLREQGKGPHRCPHPGRERARGNGR